MSVSGNKEVLILVVDDMDISRDTISNALALLGYRTVGACDGQEAIEYYRKNGDRVGLVMLDMVMPNMNGEACFKRLRKLDPDVKIVLMSGFVNGEQIQALEAEGAVGFLRKPFTHKQLAQVVEKAF